jgi:hypothetical protein
MYRRKQTLDNLMFPVSAIYSQSNLHGGILNWNGDIAQPRGGVRMIPIRRESDMWPETFQRAMEAYIHSPSFLQQMSTALGANKEIWNIWREQQFNKETAAQADVMTEQSWTRSHCCYHNLWTILTHKNTTALTTSQHTVGCHRFKSLIARNNGTLLKIASPDFTDFPCEEQGYLLIKHPALAHQNEEEELKYRVKGKGKVFPVLN